MAIKKRSNPIIEAQERIIRHQEEIIHLFRQFMKTLEDLNASTAALTDATKTNTQAVTDLAAWLGTAQPTDFQPQTDAIDAATVAVNQSTLAIQSLGPAAPPPSPA